MVPWSAYENYEYIYVNLEKKTAAANCEPLWRKEKVFLNLLLGSHIIVERERG